MGKEILNKLLESVRDEDLLSVEIFFATNAVGWKNKKLICLLLDEASKYRAVTIFHLLLDNFRNYYHHKKNSQEKHKNMAKKLFLDAFANKRHEIVEYFIVQRDVDITSVFNYDQATNFIRSQCKDPSVFFTQEEMSSCSHDWKFLLFKKYYDCRNVNPADCLLSEFISPKIVEFICEEKVLSEDVLVRHFINSLSSHTDEICMTFIIWCGKIRSNAVHCFSSLVSSKKFKSARLLLDLKDSRETIIPHYLNMDNFVPGQITFSLHWSVYCFLLSWLYYSPLSPHCSLDPVVMQQVADKGDFMFDILEIVDGVKGEWERLAEICLLGVNLHKQTRMPHGTYEKIRHILTVKIDEHLSGDLPLDVIRIIVKYIV